MVRTKTIGEAEETIEETEEMDPDPQEAETRLEAKVSLGEEDQDTPSTGALDILLSPLLSAAGPTGFMVVKLAGAKTRRRAHGRTLPQLEIERQTGSGSHK